MTRFYAPDAVTSRSRLLELLRSAAILRSTQHQRIYDYAGKPMRWIYYHWGVSLSHEGASLASLCVLEVLSQFESVQVASIGMTGVPLVATIVALGSGRYSGLCVRTEREKHGTRRLVEGIGDKTRPVVVVDDCICSGKSFKAACLALESEGYRVEGGVALVNFPGRGGVEWARALGYKFEVLFDVWSDLGMNLDEIDSTAEALPDGSSRDRKVPEGLTPADVARCVAAHILENNSIPTPPQSINFAGSASGGLMVSFRDRKSDCRIARDGFYRIEPTQDSSLGEDIVLATAKTLRSSHGAIAKYGLDRLKVAVTLFGEQTPIHPKDLDFARFGILVRSNVFPRKLGGALPNTQFFVSEIEQLRHARFTNASLDETEPFSLYRHSVVKSVESSCVWPAYGVPEAVVDRAQSDRFGASLIARTRQILRETQESSRIGKCQDQVFPGSEDVPAIASPMPIYGLAVSLYHKGMIGCWATCRGNLEQMLRAATTGAWGDDRYTLRKQDLDLEKIDVVVSIFCGIERLVSAKVDQAAIRLRLGKDSLFAWKGRQSGTILSYIPCQYDWSRKQMAEFTLNKAGINDNLADWTFYATRSWLGRQERVVELEAGFPTFESRRQTPNQEQIVRLLADHIVNQSDDCGIPAYCYYPMTDQKTTYGSAVRQILAIESLLDAHQVLCDDKFREVACRGLESFCASLGEVGGKVTLGPDQGQTGASADVALINAVFRSGETRLIEMPKVQAVKRRLAEMFHGDGAITWERQGNRLRSDQDLFPGSALRMVANLAAIEGIGQLPESLPAQLEWYRRRFRIQPRWGMVWWQIQGWAAIQRLKPDPKVADFIFELADWALDNQLEINGAFLVDYNADGPSFHTACVMEGLADAWDLAHSAKDQVRSERYALSWRRALDFIRRLILVEESTFAMKCPDRCLGGVRATLTSSALRIDYTAHTLSAIAKGCLLERKEY